MKRTIKFRGKKQTNGVWVYGCLVYSNEIDASIYFQTGNGSVKTMDWVYVNPETVGQFTGLYDKNGKEIYDGDIIYSEFPDGSKTNCLIGWNEEKSCFGLMDEYNYRSKLEGYDFPRFDNAIFCNFLKHSKKFEVIGNIYDNPELLKGGEE